MTRDTGGHKVIAKASKVYGRRLWAVFEDADGFRFIVLFLCNGSKEDWGYKAVSEDMGPVEVDCPLSYLELAPYVEGKSGSYAKEWRERVKKYHEGASRKYNIGDPVIVYGRHYTVTGMRKRSYILDGQYRCSAAKMRPAERPESAAEPTPESVPA